MFEKEAEEYYYKKVFAETNPKNETELKEKFLQTFKDSAEFGYNKANEWHNLQKNPKDFPKNSDYEKLYLVYWGENNYGVAQFNDSRWWSFDSGLFNVEEVIAWCELLEFIECRT